MCIVLLAFFFVTCNFGQSASGLPVEYTDVVYSPDGMQVTLYLDGVGVPVTQQQRALTTDMAKMAHDYYEVFFNYFPDGYFTNPDTQVYVRAGWEIGQSAGVSGVYRQVPTDYSSVISTPYNGIATIFAGRKVDKTLLGVGGIIAVDGAPGAVIGPDTKNVTFKIGAVTTKLAVGSDLIPNTGYSFLTNAKNLYTSFNTMSAEDTDGYYINLNGEPYPLYILPRTTSSTQRVSAIYYFETGSYGGGIQIEGNESVIFEKRIPAYRAGGQTLEIQYAYDTTTTVNVESLNYLLIINGFTYRRPLAFTFRNLHQSTGGLFALAIQVAVNSSPDDFVPYGMRSIWYLRSAFGENRYLLDNGKDGSGGMLLIGVGIQSLDLIEINTN